eukprot:5384000-Pleurochrysis_carterae.AAC.3
MGGASISFEGHTPTKVEEEGHDIVPDRKGTPGPLRRKKKSAQSRIALHKAGIEGALRRRAYCGLRALEPGRELLEGREQDALARFCELQLQRVARGRQQREHRAHDAIPRRHDQAAAVRTVVVAAAAIGAVAVAVAASIAIAVWTCELVLHDV